jgi:glutamyl-tRNA reductase
VALIVAGISHATAPIEIREKIGFRAHEALRELERLREAGITREGVALSTCNRTEIYAVEQDGDALPEISAMFSRRLGRDAAKFMYVRRERNVATHLFGVAAGLESMILGEAQIHGQVKQAWEECKAESGPILNRMFQTALLAGGRAREETGIGRSAASAMWLKSRWNV